MENNEVYRDVNYVEIGEKHNSYMVEGFRLNEETGEKGKPVAMALDFGLDKDIQSEHYDVLSNLPIDEYYELILSNMKNENAKEDFHLIMSTINNVDSYSQLVDEFNSIEKRVNERYEGLDYGVIMSSLELGKKSALIWFDKESGGLNLGERYLNEEGTVSSTSRKKSVERDVLGSALGMVGWAITGGAVLGPFGALGGMVAATVYGAATGSLFNV